MADPQLDKPRVGISSCLLGARVRFDGEHKLDPLLIDQLGPAVQWVAVCPEVEVGMGIPRQSVRLVRLGRSRAGIRMIGNDSGEDWTARMRDFAARRVDTLQGLCGYILKSKSPSCGMQGVKLHAGAEKDAAVSLEGVGLFAQTLRQRFPDLPIEEEGRLHDRALRDSFIERLFAYQRTRSRVHL